MDQKEFFLLGGSRYFWAYSGRFMYGESCPAIEAESFKELAEVLEEVMDEYLDTLEDERGTPVEAREAVSFLCDLLRGMACDELGRGMVSYWPHVRLTAEEVKAFAKEDV